MSELAPDKQSTSFPYVCNVVETDGTVGTLVGGAIDSDKAVTIGCTAAALFKKPVVIRDARDDAMSDIAYIGTPK